MNILAGVVVQIIGLAVLRNDCQLGMHVVLPRIEGLDVESHTAILAFKTAARVDAGNDWPSQQLIPLPGYSYVSLNGERIRFIVNGANPQAEIPAMLPHLKRSCSRMNELSEGYQPPAYTAAAAVALIPKGVTDACRAIAPNIDNRIDTRVSIANTGPYQVVACNKSITLRDDAVVAIINAPTAWLQAAAGSRVSHPHSEAYFGMGRNIANTMGQQITMCALERPGPVPPCATSRIDAHLPHSGVAPAALAAALPVSVLWIPSPQDTFPVSFTTFECSNTQWP